MIYCVDPSVDEPIMLINQHIGMDEEDGMGVDGALFQNELLLLDGMGKKTIKVWINSPGGVIMDGYNICSAILKSKTPVDTYNVGMAASMAGVIFLMGRKRYMADYAVLMMHPPVGSEDRKVFDALLGSIVKMLSAKSSITEDKVKYLVDRTSWLDASDCKDMGFCTDVEMTSEQNQKWVPLPTEASQVKAKWRERSVMVNNLLKPQNKKVMAFPKLMAKMNLNPEATEDSVLFEYDKLTNRAHDAEKDLTVEKEKSHQEILKIQNKAKLDVDAARAEVETVKGDLTKATNELTTTKDALAKKETELVDLKKAKDLLEKEKNDAIAAEKKTKAETMVNGYVKTGRLKLDTTEESKKAIDKWVALAIDDFEGTETMIKAIPLTKESKTITETSHIVKTGDTDPSKVGASAIHLAAKNRLKRQGKFQEAEELGTA